MRSQQVSWSRHRVAVEPRRLSGALPRRLALVLTPALALAVVAACVPQGAEGPNPRPTPGVDGALPGSDTDAEGFVPGTDAGPTGADGGCESCLPYIASCSSLDCGACAACGDGNCDPAAGEDCHTCLLDCNCRECADPCAGPFCCGDMFCDPVYHETCLNCGDCACGTQTCQAILACVLACVPIPPGGQIDCAYDCYGDGCAAGMIQMVPLMDCMFRTCDCGQVPDADCQSCVDASCASALAACGSGC